MSAKRFFLAVLMALACASPALAQWQNNPNFVIITKGGGGSGGTGNALFGTTSGNTANDIVTMSNTTVGVRDSGTLLSSLAPKASPTFSGVVTGPDAGTWTSGGINGSAIGGSTAAAGSFTTVTASSLITAENGTRTNPSIVFASGTQTGFYWTGGDTVIYATSNHNSLLIGDGLVKNESQAPYGWSATNNDASAALDTTLCRSAAGTVEIGTTACNASGSGAMTNLAATGTTIAFANLTTATGSYVCWNAGTISIEAAACPASTMEAKSPVGWLSPRYAAEALDKVRAAVFTYKNVRTYGFATRVGLYAQEVANMDKRCASYDSKGVIQNYDPTCLIAFLIADRQNMRAELASAKRPTLWDVLWNTLP